jgi:hypothetical protein
MFRIRRKIAPANRPLAAPANVSPDISHSSVRIAQRQTSPGADAERRECRLTQFAADETELGAQHEKRCEQSARRALWISRSSFLFATNHQRRRRPHKNPIYWALELDLRQSGAFAVSRLVIGAACSMFPLRG